MKIKIIFIVFVFLLSGCSNMDKEKEDQVHFDEMNKRDELAKNFNASLDIYSLFKDSSDLDVKSEEVVYFNNVSGFYSRPNDNNNYPGVIMIHEWWGLNDNIKEMAKQLASKGYQVLAVDLYNGEVAQDANRARELRLAINQNESIDNMKAAANFLRESGSVKLASLGWCFGGQQSLLVSTSGEKLDATIIYYGSLGEGDVSKMTGPVLGIFGRDDGSISVDSVNDFENRLNAVGVINDINIYDGVGHAFANPTGNNYGVNQTKDAWEKTLNFLDNNLK